MSGGHRRDYIRAIHSLMGGNAKMAGDNWLDECPRPSQAEIEAEAVRMEQKVARRAAIEAEREAVRERIRTGAPVGSLSSPELNERLTDIEIALGLRDPRLD